MVGTQLLAFKVDYALIMSKSLEKTLRPNRGFDNFHRMHKRDEIEAYVGLGIAVIFSIGFLILLVRASKKAANFNYRILGILALGMVGCVTMIGNAPYVSLIQNVAISLAFLLAFFIHMGTTAAQDTQPNVRLVGLLVASMLSCLIINQASRSFEIGLLRWFKIDVHESKEQQTVLDQVRTESEKQTSLLTTQIANLSNQLEAYQHKIYSVQSTQEAHLAEDDAVSNRLTPPPALLNSVKGRLKIPSNGLDVTIGDGETKQFLTEDFRVCFVSHILDSDVVRIVNVKTTEEVLSFIPKPLKLTNFDLVVDDGERIATNGLTLLVKDFSSGAVTPHILSYLTKPSQPQ